MTEKIIDLIEKKLGYEFKNKALLVQAFTRESYAKEQRVKGLDVQSNEQLEYFGDSVLNYLVVCGQLDRFTKVMDNTGLHVLYKEGKLSEFNSHWTDKSMLSKCIDALGLAKYLIMNKGDTLQHINENECVKEDLFESLVGAMWIDSEKDILRIQNVVYNMLQIEFETTNIEKNYVSQILEFADKNKYFIDKQIQEGENGFQATYTISLGIIPKEGRIWSGTGYGNNIKQAEQNAALELITVLKQHGWYNLKAFSKMNFTLENSINCLQELNQKGYIGEINYTDDACFSSYEVPHWRVTCKIKNYMTTFIGVSRSKKEAKKKAAYDALCFIYRQETETNGYNPSDKHFKFMIDIQAENPELKVFIIDSFEDDFIYKGHLFPDNKPYEYFGVDGSCQDGDTCFEVFENGKDALLRYMELFGDFSNVHLKGQELEENLTKYIEEEYETLSEDIKNNGVLLRESLLEIAKKLENGQI